MRDLSGKKKGRSLDRPFKDTRVPGRASAENEREQAGGQRDGDVLGEARREARARL
jgi:hypothetical protein